MFKLYFNKVSGENRVFSSAPLLILKRRVIDWAIALFFCITFILMALFLNGGEKKLLLALNAVLALFLIVRSSSYVNIYENGLIYGHLLKKKTIWFDTVDSIIARLYYQSPRKTHIDPTADYSNVYRAYVFRRDGKSVFEIHETEFAKARAIETCFDINSPIIKEIIPGSI
ncbi:hypothetical protein [Intestinirhabdus alba]|uniref:Uncharacterized protein n=1 Tax=Intestinirhabdus alba TaxID=2899544 RepID=A0A6L6IRR9_9ENTR|nr:hypothetical protein [Intestinirhabdus alba]MTH48664.1 hypothetical protein [Intestinirhabdus alba]